MAVTLRNFAKLKKNSCNNNAGGLRVLKNLRERKIAIPSNLSILATINTSDEFIYYLDSAFKRRWDWEYVDVPGSEYSGDVPDKIKAAKVVVGDTEVDWSDFVIKLNEFIKSNHQAIRRIEDKQIGWWFLKPENNEISEASIKNKLMFYLWDSVFSKDRRPLESLLSDPGGEKIKLITYSQFVALAEEFVIAISDYEPSEDSV
jgi:5-methylcytosine-specific restriction endonuclease McrBC GTP-binding regulatory subunit McrB